MESFHWNEVPWVIELLITALGCAWTVLFGMAAWMLRAMASDIKELAHNSALLNERLAVTVERVDSHDQRISKLEKET